MVDQNIIRADGGYAALDEYLSRTGAKRVLLVCGNSIRHLKINAYFETLPQRLGVEVVRFSDYQPNPRYESVVSGVELLRREGCDSIIAVGGGSGMDVAKCIKLYSNMDPGENYLKQTIVPNALPLLAVPTTAGTGSEATRFAVIYYGGEKQSVTHDSCIPQTVLFDASTLASLPLFQKKCAMLDALCHAVEAFWSVHSTPQSQDYSRGAIRLILDNMAGYLAGDHARDAAMLEAANLGGKAINITQTTAGHAMCYKLTGLYGIPHGFAAALCVRRLWPFMLAHPEKCVDPRGEGYLAGMFEDLAKAMDCDDARQAADRFDAIVASLALPTPKLRDESELERLSGSVNPVRLKNNPVALDAGSIRALYQSILRGSEEADA